MSIRHTCQGSPQQISTSNCVACDLSGVGTGQATVNYGQAYGPQPGVEARRYVEPQGHAGPGYPYPTSINLSSPRVAAPPAGGEPHQPTQNPPATVGQQYPPNLGQTQQRRTAVDQQSRRPEEAVPPSTQSGRRRSKESRRSTHK
ncbi:hypothetical protein KC331_g2235 [Hortaea werneckii]|nr:hypothetical protein KC331_g2235 [Hortaea werneckii]KAI7720640.1 hypothetical protein KC353_g2023 [Hortaea werneckii]